MKTRTKIIILLIVIWQGIWVTMSVYGLTVNMVSSGLANFSFYFEKNTQLVLNIIQYVSLFGYIPIAIVGIVGLLRRRNYGRIFSILSMALFILGICSDFAQNLYSLTLSDIFKDSSNRELLVFGCVSFVSILYLDRLKIDRQSADSLGRS
jgi:hypothetical protein